MGTFFGSQTVIVANNGGGSVRLNAIKFRDGDVSDFVVGTTCFPHGRPSTLAPGERARSRRSSHRRSYGVRSATLGIDDSAPGHHS